MGENISRLIMAMWRNQELDTKVYLGWYNVYSRLKKGELTPDLEYWAGVILETEEVIKSVSSTRQEELNNG